MYEERELVKIIRFKVRVLVRTVYCKQCTGNLNRLKGRCGNASKLEASV